MALGIQQGTVDQRSASGADREALGEKRHGQAPVLQRGFLDHGFGGRGQEGRFAKLPTPSNSVITASSITNAMKSDKCN